MNRGSQRLAFLGRIEGLPIAAVLAVLYAVFILTAPQVFTGYRIYMSFFQTVPPMLVLALGLTFVITAGEIDLSFPAVVALSGFIFTWVFKNLGAPWLGFALALASGALVGYLNGLLVARLRVPSIMATLATQFFWYGVTLLIASGLQINIESVTATAIHAIFVGRLFGVFPVQALWAFALTVFLWFILNRHRFGEAVMFIGDNAEVARVMGINVEAMRMRLFVVHGVIAAFAGLLLTLEINVFFPTQGQGMLLPVMAAVFIGGTSIAGGQPVLVGTFFGSYIIGSLEAGVVATGIGGYWVQLVEGIVMAASVILNVVLGEEGAALLSRTARRWAGGEGKERTGGGSRA
ncbi:MAG TPA: ABC transporter permease [Rectinemataceae bacterium]|nr:ABC transporter permease [Rectinemataceae bacterium]